LFMEKELFTFIPRFFYRIVLSIAHTELKCNFIISSTRKGGFCP